MYSELIGHWSVSHSGDSIHQTIERQSWSGSGAEAGGRRGGQATAQVRGEGALQARQAGHPRGHLGGHSDRQDGTEPRHQ